MKRYRNLCMCIYVQKRGHTRTRWEGSSLQDRRVSSPETNLVGFLLLHVKSPEEKVNIYSFKLSNLWYFVMAVHTDKYTPFLFLFRILRVAQNDGSVFFTVPFCMINSSYVAFLTSYVTFNLLGTLCFRPPSFGLIFQARSLWNSKHKLFAFKLVL